MKRKEKENIIVYIFEKSKIHISQIFFYAFHKRNSLDLDLFRVYLFLLLSFLKFFILFDVVLSKFLR